MVDLEYIEWLIAKASPKSDSPMLVDWLPYVKELVESVKDWENEYKKLRADYDEAVKKRKVER